MKQKSKNTKGIIKTKSLFDHVNHIKKVQDPKYYIGLSDVDKKSFTPYMILRVLSMTENDIGIISYISKYLDILSDENLYTLLIQVIEKNHRFDKYIKSVPSKVNSEVVNCLCKKFNIGTRDVNDYVDILYSTDKLEELSIILKEFGYSDKEIKKLIKI
jgi:hypothetical protein